MEHIYEIAKKSPAIKKLAEKRIDNFKKKMKAEGLSLTEQKEYLTLIDIKNETT